LEKDISYGFEGTVYTDVCSVAAQVPAHASLHNFIGGLGGRSIGNEDVRTIFDTLLGNSRNADTGNVTFVHMGVSID
jgi:pyruvate ferredoxin oxidoreductase alpha subunit